MFGNFISHQIFSEFLQPLRDLRIQRVASFYRGFLLICFLDFIGLVNIGTVVDTVTGEMSFSIRSSRSRVLVLLTVGDEHELEEDVEQ